jgi:hypothetical protein
MVYAFFNASNCVYIFLVKKNAVCKQSWCNWMIWCKIFQLKFLKENIQKEIHHKTYNLFADEHIFMTFYAYMTQFLKFRMFTQSGISQSMRGNYKMRNKRKNFRNEVGTYIANNLVYQNNKPNCIKTSLKNINF